MRKKSWTKEDLVHSVLQATSVRQVISKLGLVEAGGNYDQVKKYISLYKLDTSHFTGSGWRKGKTFPQHWRVSLQKVLTKNSHVQSFKLKNRLIFEGLKTNKCELCGWCEQSPDGRIPVELDHINGNKNDNRIENLRILCPNCHSLQPTHRGLNKRKNA